jgi:hypothetical protein
MKWKVNKPHKKMKSQPKTPQNAAFLAFNSQFNLLRQNLFKAGQNKLHLQFVGTPPSTTDTTLK